jgi:hypothetical protein
MSTIGMFEALVDDALVRQEARHATEDGRDLTREKCLEAMAQAIYLTEATSLTYTTDYAKAALDAAIASGYVVVNKP